jgi:uncharacterized protein (UPF0276 family)
MMIDAAAEVGFFEMHAEHYMVAGGTAKRALGYGRRRGREAAASI